MWHVCLNFHAENLTFVGGCKNLIAKFVKVSHYTVAAEFAKILIIGKGSSDDLVYTKMTLHL